MCQAVHANRIDVMRRILLVIIVCIVCPAGSVGNAGAGPLARPSGSCSAFSLTFDSAVAGGTRFFDWAYAIHAARVSCAAARVLIRRHAESLDPRGRGFGVGYPLGKFRCTDLRPFAGRSRFLHASSVCRRGQESVGWSERTLRSQPVK